jgi:hypothetical protein
MATDQEPKDTGITETPTTGNEDKLKNLQAEMQRKIDNQAQLAQETKAQLDTILAMMNSRQEPQAPAKPVKKIGDLMFDDPEAAVQQIADQVGKQVLSRVNSKDALTRSAQQLEFEYPEFADRTSEHYKRVESYYNQLPNELKNTPQGLENAAYKAAAEYGLIPKSKRQNSSGAEDFSVSSGSSNRRQTKGEKSGDMQADQLAFARLLGAPLDNPKFKEVFKKANNRKEWNKYKGED